MTSPAIDQVTNQPAGENQPAPVTEGTEKQMNLLSMRLSRERIEVGEYDRRQFASRLIARRRARRDAEMAVLRLMLTR